MGLIRDRLEVHRGKAGPTRCLHQGCSSPKVVRATARLEQHLAALQKSGPALLLAIAASAQFDFRKKTFGPSWFQHFIAWLDGKAHGRFSTLSVLERNEKEAWDEAARPLGAMGAALLEHKGFQVLRL
jgi:hypothetical protein